jgi:hypothetical protein
MEDMNRLQQIDLANDRLLPTVRSMVIKAYREAQRESPPGAYVQVLNLFYLCDAKFSSAVKKMQRVVDPPTDKSEAREFPWIMHLWGGPDHRKDFFAARFRELAAGSHFFFDKNLDRLVSEFPGPVSFPKHTQGLTLDPIIKHLAMLIRRE